MLEHPWKLAPIEEPNEITHCESSCAGKLDVHFGDGRSVEGIDAAELLAVFGVDRTSELAHVPVTVR